MKKKIFAIAIIVVLLTVGVTVSSAQTTKKEDNLIKSEDPLPDLQVKMKYSGKNVYAIIYNMGDGALEKGTEFIWILQDSNGKLYSTCLVELPRTLNQGQFYLAAGPTLSIFRDYGQKFTVTVDPPKSDVYDSWPEFDPNPEYGVILESIENNNEDTKIYSLPRSIHRNGLMILLEKFPVLKQLLRL